MAPASSVVARDIFNRFMLSKNTKKKEKDETVPQVENNLVETTMMMLLACWLVDSESALLLAFYIG